MVLTDAERKAKKAEYQRNYHQKNKEIINAKKREYRKNNPELMKEQYDNRLEKRMEYERSPNRKKKKILWNWKDRGLIHDNMEELYKHYLNTLSCNVCKVEFTKNNKRCLDHDHDTGEFRAILCNSCNVFDNWKKRIDKE